MASRIPGARKIVIPDAGHNVNLDQPEAFNAAVLDFLAEIGW
jgi:pimeloyl-ACP methyl ester carboxylesterase